MSDSRARERHMVRQETVRCRKKRRSQPKGRSLNEGQALKDQSSTGGARLQVTSATAAREAAGLTVVQAARKVRICPAYLRHCEKNGASYGLALRLAALFHCDISLFLWPGAVGHPRTPGRGRTLPGGS